MLGVIVRGLIGAVPVLFLVSLITFGLMRFIPGDPSAAIAGLAATAQQIEAIPAPQNGRDGKDGRDGRDGQPAQRLPWRMVLVRDEASNLVDYVNLIPLED